MTSYDPLYNEIRLLSQKLTISSFKPLSHGLGFYAQDASLADSPVDDSAKKEADSKLSQASSFGAQLQKSPDKPLTPLDTADPSTSDIHDQDILSPLSVKLARLKPTKSAAHPLVVQKPKKRRWFFRSEKTKAKPHHPIAIDSKDLKSIDDPAKVDNEIFSSRLHGRASGNNQKARPTFVKRMLFRLLSWQLDLLVLVLGSFVAVLMGAVFDLWVLGKTVDFDHIKSHFTEHLSQLSLESAVLSGVVFLVLYWIVFTLAYGKTPGKRISLLISNR